MRLSKIVNTSTALVRKFQFLAGTAQPFRLDVTLEYLPPVTLNNEQEKERVRILGKRSFNNIEDLEEQNRELALAFHTILATRVKKIEGLTLRTLANLVALDAPSVKGLLEQMKLVDPENAAKGVNAVIAVDATDTTKITDEERQVFDYEEKVQTRGDAAFDTILFLLNGSDRFSDWVVKVMSDVSLFQDKDWEEQLKN